MPKPLVRFLLQWYTTQQLSVCWMGRTSKRFEVTNGVRQGGVLSPVLFAVYLDSLLDSLCLSGHCKNIWVTSTIFWSSQLHTCCVSKTLYELHQKMLTI